MKKYIIIIIVLLMIICGLTAYIVFGEKSNQKTITNNERPKVVEEKTDVTTLSEGGVATYLQKINMLNNRFYYHIPFSDVKDISNQEALQLASIYVVGNISTASSQPILGFGSGKIVEGLNYFFGSDYEYKLEDINCESNDGIIFKYNKENEMFERVGIHGHDGFTNVRTKAFFQDATLDEEKGEITINVKVLNAGNCAGTCGPKNSFSGGIYSDHKNRIVYEAKEETSFEDAYAHCSKDIPITTYKFIKNKDQNYGIKSIITKDE